MTEKIADVHPTPKTLKIVERAREHGNRTAIVDGDHAHDYAELLQRSEAVASALLQGRPDLAETRVAFLAPAGFEYFSMQWGIWRAGGIAVPLSVAATHPELDHVLRDSEAEIVIVMRAFAASVPPLQENVRLLYWEDLDPQATGALPEIQESRRAMILYTSGTTSRPKGVVSTHASLRAQIETLVAAWHWSADDRIPLFLPLHHIHGIVNIACCALWSGACIETFPKFIEPKILSRVAAGAYTVFMAVPTIYVKLIDSLRPGNLPDEERARILQGFSRMRLMVSGSSALPASVHHEWRELTGQVLLERYGMTETGMILSNPYHGERRPGTVGQPLPSVEVRLRTENGEPVQPGEPGEVQVRGPMVFREYWQQPEATRESFTDGWFRTGDMALLEDGYYRILGRLATDIIKSGGYKISALEIEAAVMEHPAIRECAVVGIADQKWGEVIALAAALEEGQKDLSLHQLNEWSRTRLSPYKLPRKLLVLDRLPRNGMGKVQKKAITSLLMQKPTSGS